MLYLFHSKSLIQAQSPYDLLYIYVQSNWNDAYNKLAKLVTFDTFSFEYQEAILNWDIHVWLRFLEFHNEASKHC